MPPIGWYALVFAVAIAATALATWPARTIAIKIGYVDIPSDRKMHDRATPYGGGGAMFIGVCLAIAVASLIPALKPVFSQSSEVVGVLIASAAIFLVGLIDDFRAMSAPAKIAGQVLAASILYFAGVTMYQFKLPFAGFVILSPGMIPLITALWVVALTNAINLIDGLDGLAAGLVALEDASGRPAVWASATSRCSTPTSPLPAAS